MTDLGLYTESVKAGNTEGVSVWNGVVWLEIMSSVRYL